MTSETVHKIKQQTYVTWRYVLKASMKLWVTIRSIDYTNRQTHYIAGGLALMLILAVVTYRILNPAIVLEGGDIHPFESREEYAAFIEENPLFGISPPKGQGFTKSGSISDDKVARYEIRLSERPLKPVMDTAYRENYLAYLERSQQKALDWIKSTGQNPDELYIVWYPDPQVMRSKLLGETDIKPAPNKNYDTDSDGATTPSTTPTPTPTPSSTGGQTPVDPPSGRFPF